MTPADARLAALPLVDDPYQRARDAADQLVALAGPHDLAVVLGSGWSETVDALGPAEHEILYTKLPGFSAPTAVGHSGRLRSVVIGGHRVLILSGRTHLYEGRGVGAVVHAVRTAVAAGCGTVLLTNGSGGLRADLRPGQPVLISDHINHTGDSPLRGATFVDLTDLYSARLRRLARTAAPELTEGTYLGLRGPQFETPAEIRMFRGWGADLVGMSTTLEAIAAREAGAEVLGISLVTNLAAGMTGEPLSAQEVIATGEAAAGRLGGLLHAVITGA
ncbi:purine-nucleoside phosphorylase [Catenulispora sp. GP43]|uniref:purine-nucleoside phosphorylase n=1 Tax=Catenulispora sp. GP43 TaxID=3156263 RepID=UPI00351458AE